MKIEIGGKEMRKMNNFLCRSRCEKSVLKIVRNKNIT